MITGAGTSIDVVGPGLRPSCDAEIATEVIDDDVRDLGGQDDLLTPIGLAEAVERRRDCPEAAQAEHVASVLAFAGCRSRRNADGRDCQQGRKCDPEFLHETHLPFPLGD